MNNKYTFPLILLIIVAVITLVGALAHGSTFAVFDPRGLIAAKERGLIEIAVLLMLLVVIPVFFLTFAFAWRYRATNTHARYTPNWEHNLAEEFIWWAIPTMIIIVLAVITWTSSHELDPYRPIGASTKTMTIQVVALNWKWLFIYPGERIATVNYLEIPAHVPIDFELAADAPMNSLWIPQLGGQIMAMPGMVTHLNLIADQTGTYTGVSGNYSGEGFAGMHFPVEAVSQTAFNAWASSTADSGHVLDRAAYLELAKPSSNNPAAFYALGDANLYNWIVMKFMAPMASTTPKKNVPTPTQPAPHGALPIPI